MSGESTSWEQEVRDHQEFRSQMVRSFGFTVMDHGVALTRCPQCAAVTSVNSAFPDSDWTSLPHLISVLETYMEAADTRARCSSCSAEFSLGDAAPGREYWLWHAHYLSQVKLDLQVLIHRRKGETGWIEGMLVGSENGIVPLSVPVSEEEFRARAGCYFSVRQAWREFLHRNWPVSQFAGLDVSPGYYLVVSPPVDSDEDLVEFKNQCVKLVEKTAKPGSHYEFADLSWADSWQFEENTYHDWLSEYEKDLEESEVIAGVLASPQEFYDIVQAEIKPFQCWLRKEGDNSTVAFLGDDEYYVSLDYREFLINAMIKGYSYWGALRYVEPIMDAWEQSRDIGERLKKLLKQYKCTVYGGKYFQVRARRGKKIVREFDLLALDGEEGEFESQDEFVSWIAPQIALDPETLTFDPAG